MTSFILIPFEIGPIVHKLQCSGIGDNRVFSKGESSFASKSVYCSPCLTARMSEIDVLQGLSSSSTPAAVKPCGEKTGSKV